MVESNIPVLSILSANQIRMTTVGTSFLSISIISLINKTIHIFKCKPLFNQLKILLDIFPWYLFFYRTVVVNLGKPPLKDRHVRFTSVSLNWQLMLKISFVFQAVFGIHSNPNMTFIISNPGFLYTLDQKRKFESIANSFWSRRQEYDL